LAKQVYPNKHAMPDSPFAQLDALPTTPDAESPTDRRRWQFSIRGMLIFTTSIAIGLSAMLVHQNCWFGTGRAPDDFTVSIGEGWIGGLFAVFVVWICIGFFYQARDLWNLQMTPGTLDIQQRHGRNFEIFWRLCILAIIVFYTILAVLLDRHAIKLARLEEVMFFDPADALREGIFVVLLLAVVGGIPSARRETKWTPLLAFFYAIAFLAAIALCLPWWMDATSIQFLVHIATVGIDTCQPGKYAAIDHKHYPANTRFFYEWSMISSAIVVANGFFLCRLANQWSRGTFRRWLWGGLLIAGIAVVGTYVVWIEVFGLKQISPFFAEVRSLHSVRTWFSAIALLMILATAWTYKMTADWQISPEIASPAWRRNSEKYFHEGRLFLFVLATTLFLIFAYTCYQAYQIYCQQSPFWVPPGSVFPCLGFVANIAVCPTYHFWFALFALTIAKLFSRRNNFQPPQAEIPRLNLAKFAVIWLAAAAFAVTGGAALAWMSFALWFSPWVTAR
jgi:hypothetical protein